MAFGPAGLSYVGRLQSSLVGGPSGRIAAEAAPTPGNEKGPPIGGPLFILVAGAGFEPATFGL